MKHLKRYLSFAAALLLCLMTAAVLPAVPASAEAGPGTLTDEVSRETREITLADGTSTGVTWTQIRLDGYY